MNLKRLNRYYYLKLKRLRDDPKVLAKGTAFGVLIGLTPTMPFHTILIIVLTVITRSSTIAGIIISCIVCNPLTFLPIYYFSVMIGNAITPYETNWETVSFMVDQLIRSESIFHSMSLAKSFGTETLIVMILGSLVFAFPLALMSYILSLFIFRKWHHKRRSKATL